MTTKGIIFSAPMVLALLDGRKSQTRRWLKGAPKGDWFCDKTKTGLRWVAAPGAPSMPVVLPYAVGDILYVREYIRLWSKGHDSEITFAADDHRFETGPNTGQIPDPSLASYFRFCDRSVEAGKAVSIPSIHMPRWASRMTLVVTDVRVQRLQQIGREDAIAEGLIHKAGVIEPDWWMLPEPMHQGSFLSPVAAYRWLWNELHTDPDTRWDDNPWVVAVSFERVIQNVDEFIAACALRPTP